MAYGILQVKSKYCGLVGRSFSIQTLMTMARPVVSTRKSPGAVVQADFESEFENVEILPTTFDKPASVVENIFNEIDERGNWIKRCNAIKKLRSAMLSAELSILILSDIPKLARKLNSCFTDLRSQIVRETCVTFAFIAQLEKSKCERLAEFCLPTMLDLVNASAKVISSSASVASTIMFKHVQSFRLIAVLVDKYNSKSRDIRRLCASLMRFSLQTWNDANLKKIPKTQVANFITNILDDADQKVRADGQEAFALLYKFDEEMAIGVMKRFTGARRRQIEAIVTSLRNKAAQGERTPVTPKRVTALKPSALPVLIANHSPARTPLPKRTSVKSHFCKPVRSDHKPTLPTDVKLAEKQDLKIEIETEMENNPIPRDSCLLETSNESDNVELLQDVQKDVHPPLKLREMLASLNEMNKVDQMTTILEPVDMELETIGEPTEESSSVEEITGKCPKPVIKLSSPFDENLSSDHEPLLEKGNIETSGQNKDGSTTLKNEAFIFDLTTNKLQVLQLDSSEQEEHVQMKFDENSSSVEIDLIQFSSVDESEKCSDLISLSSVQENSPKLSMSDRRITLSVFDNPVSFTIKKFDENTPLEEINLIEFSETSFSEGEQLSSMNTSILKKQTASLKSDGDTVGQSTVSTSSPDAFRVSNDVQCDIDNQRATRDVNLDETAIEDSNLLKDTESVRAQYRGTFEDDLVQMDIIMEICKQFPIPEADIVIQSIDSWPKLVSLYCQGNKETKPIVIFALEHLFNANQHLPLAGNVHTVRFLRALLEDIFSYKDDDADDSITLLLLINEKQPIETLKTIAIDGKFSDHLIKLLDDIINVFNLPEC